MATKSSLLVTLFLFTLFLSQITATIDQNNAFHFIEQLEGSQKGQNIHGLNELKKYLEKFGYLNLDHHHDIDEFDETLESAIKEYQLNFNIKVTGKLDGDTVKQMIRPRCGVSDNVNVEQTLKWPSSKTHLTYRFTPGETLNLNVKSIFAVAFEKWAEVTHFTFKEDGENPAVDIEIGFHRGDHGDGNSFDGSGGVFGHVIGREKRAGILQIHLDDDEKWNFEENLGIEEMDLESIAVHEIGHILGLDHNNENPEAIMHPIIDKGVAKRYLHEDDIKNVHAIYMG